MGRLHLWVIVVAGGAGGGARGTRLGQELIPLIEPIYIQLPTSLISRFIVTSNAQQGEL